jgi:hypothetical protein
MDAVFDFQAGLFAHVVHGAHKVARIPFLHQLGRQRRINGDRHAFVASDCQPATRFRLHQHFLRAQRHGLAVHAQRQLAVLLQPRHGTRCVQFFQCAPHLGEIRAVLGPQQAIIGQDLVVHQFAHFGNHLDLLDVDLFSQHLCQF